jgi:hypothetical protein
MRTLDDFFSDKEIRQIEKYDREGYECCHDEDIIEVSLFYIHPEETRREREWQHKG